MKALIDLIISWFTKLRNLVFDPFDQEIKKLEELEKEYSDIPSEEAGRARQRQVAVLRDDADKYHQASMAYLAANPGSDFSSFDSLPSAQKQQYFK